MKIALFMQNRPHFGANLLHIPLIYSLSRCYPDATIVLFSKNNSSKMLLDVTAVEKVVVTDSKLDEIKAYKAFQADMTFSLRKNSLPVTLAAILFNAKGSYGYANFLADLFFTKTRPFEQDRFRAQSYLDLLPESCQKSYLPAIASTEKSICLMPGGAFSWKHWEITNYLKLADKLQTRHRDHKILFIMGGAEQHYVPLIKAWPNSYEVFVDQPLKALFKQVQSARLVIANDCGPSHIAQISEVPNIILYSSETNDGNKVAKEWFRVKEYSYFLVGEQGKSIDSISVESVFETALKALDKQA